MHSTREEFLSQLLKDLGTGKIQLPDFQRGWVWDNNHIREIIGSIIRSFPIGAVMMLETGGNVRFQSRPVEGISFASDPIPEPERLILDGQQRLTSLYQATCLGRGVETVDERRRKICRSYYINIQKVIEELIEIDSAIVDLPDSRQIKNFRGEVVEDYSTAEQEYAAGLFPLNSVFSYSQWRQGFNKFWKYEDSKVELFDRFETLVLESFRVYQVPVINLKKETSREAICLIFEKVNTGGVSLNAFELLTATYAADKFNLREDWFGDPRKQIVGREQKLKHFKG
jgi:uncharacterized protein with ParB-like and HNH nuclease domain